MHPEDAIQRAREVIQRAGESGSPADAQGAIREIDSVLKFLTDPKDRAGLLLEKATSLGILRQFEDAKAQLKVARDEAPDDEVTNLAFEHIYAGICHQQGEFDEAYERNTALLRNIHAGLLRKSAGLSTKTFNSIGPSS